MASEVSTEPNTSKENEEEEEEEEFSSSDESDSSDSESETEQEKTVKPEEPVAYVRLGEEVDELDNSPETNVRLFNQALESKRLRRMMEEEERNYVNHEDLFDFPEDPENWKEEDLRELWADAPLEMTKPGWDPAWADEDDWDIVRKEIAAGRDPPIAPFYVPYRKPYPVIPDNHHDISNPKSVIEELDRIEEFLTWVSYIFPDGSS